MPLPFGQASFPEISERELVGPLFQPWAELLLREVDLRNGDRVLDVACGTGIVGRLARGGERQGLVECIMSACADVVERNVVASQFACGMTATVATARG